VVIPAGVAAATIRVTAIPDNRVEPDETLWLIIKQASAYQTGGSPSAMITIKNQSPPPTNSLTVTLTGAVDGASLDRFNVLPLEARVSASGTVVERVSFFDGTNLLVAVAKFPYVMTFDGRFPGEHRLSARVTDNLGRVATSSVVRVTVRGAPLPVVTIRATTPTVVEGSGNPAGRFTINRTGDLSHEFFVRYRAEGTARAGEDYTALPGWILIPAGASSVTVPVASRSDRLKEGDETVILRLVQEKFSPGTRIGPELDYELGTDTEAKVTILDDDAANQPPAVQIVYPSTGAQVRAGGSVLFRADALDRDGLVTKVDFLADNRVVASFSTQTSIQDPTGRLYDTYGQWRNVPPGRHVIVARARDDSGNVAMSLPLVIEAVESTPDIARAGLTLMLEAVPLSVGQDKDDHDCVFFLGAPAEYYRVEVAKHAGEWESVGLVFSGAGFFRASLEDSDVLPLEHYRATRVFP
jgi:hypothetical protein